MRSKCEDKECGNDGCNGTCGLCQKSASCFGGKCTPNTEAVCNDGLDNDNDKVVDCDEKECWGVGVGAVKITIATSWYSAYAYHKWTKDDLKYHYPLMDSEENVEFQYEQQFNWNIYCPMEFNLDVGDLWIKTDGAVLIENPTPYAITIFTEAFLNKVNKPICWYDSFDAPLGFKSGIFYDWCVPAIDEDGIVVGPFSQTKFGSIPPDQQQVFLVRWKYYQLLPPTE